METKSLLSGFVVYSDIAIVPNELNPRLSG